MTANDRGRPDWETANELFFELDRTLKKSVSYWTQNYADFHFARDVEQVRTV